MNEKKLTKLLMAQANRYNVKRVKVAKQGNGHFQVTAWIGNGTVIVNGAPATTTTADKHVAQNVLKRVREAYKLGDNSAAYGGGKA